MAFVGSDYKKFAYARALADNLGRRLAQLSTAMVVVQGVDASNNPFLTIQPAGAFTWASGAQYAIVKIVPFSNIGTDAFGNGQSVYSPFKAQVLVEGNTFITGSIPASSDANSVLSYGVELALMGELLRTGVKIEVFDVTHGTEPLTSMPASTTSPTAVFDDLMWPTLATL